MELLTFNIDISSFHPHIRRKMHAQFNTIIIIFLLEFINNS